jgi:DNA-binding transcriptional LysR family regulator
MAKDLFASLDLNLLRTFIVLNQERNMRRAAERLFVSQPAVSKALQRLRNHFDDELFVKTQQGLRATEKANQLAESVGPIIDDLTIAINHSNEFDPSQLSGTIKIAISPFFLTSIASKLFEAIRSDAPDLQVQLLNWSKSTLKDLTNDDIQFGLSYAISYAPKELIQKKVAEDHFKAYVRHDHPYTKDSLNVEDAMNFELATLIAADWNLNQSNAEIRIREQGYIPKIVFRSELPSAVIEVVKNSDILFPCSHFLELDNEAGLRAIELEADYLKSITDLNTFYHHKNRNSMTIRWLEKKVREVLAGY